MSAAPPSPTSPTTPAFPKPLLHIRRAGRRQNQGSTFTSKLTVLRHPLQPLFPLPDGEPHPYFPRMLLHYHLLTEAELDSLALYYHQCLSPSHPLAHSRLPHIPSVWTYSYPATMNWNWAFLAHVGSRLGMEKRVAVKRRMLGKFIGLRGCQTPAWEREERELWETRANMAKTEYPRFDWY